jgi:hypothetical protein
MYEGYLLGHPNRSWGESVERDWKHDTHGSDVVTRSCRVKRSKSSINDDLLRKGEHEKTVEAGALKIGCWAPDWQARVTTVLRLRKGGKIISFGITLSDERVSVQNNSVMHWVVEILGVVVCGTKWLKRTNRNVFGRLGHGRKARIRSITR